MGVLGIALVIFLVLLLINIGIIVITFIKGGKLVKKDIAFAATQLYTVIISIILLAIRTEGKAIGYLIGILFILCSIGVIFLKRIDFLLARILSVVVLVLSNISFWYNENHMALSIITVALIGLTVATKHFIDKKMYFG